MCVGYGLAPGTHLYMPCATLTRLVGHVTNAISRTILVDTGGNDVLYLLAPYSRNQRQIRDIIATKFVENNKDLLVLGVRICCIVLRKRYTVKIKLMVY